LSVGFDERFIILFWFDGQKYGIKLMEKQFLSTAHGIEKHH